ncbi:MAG: replicative DNA helicase [Burkholderiaceae bacterium]|nr:MAG: replicative DNA helicase [Burkholderiaceae bacterium]
MTQQTPLEALQVPPHSVEAEQSVLGGIMLVRESLDLVMDRINEKDFYRRDHQLIWRAIVELDAREQPVDAVTLGEWFEAQGLAELIGGPAYLTEIANNTPSAANIAAYADIVRDRSILRKLIDASWRISSESFNPQGKESSEVLEMAEQSIFGIAEAGARGRKDFVGMNAAVTAAFKVITQRYENQGTLSGLSTGFEDLDRITNGLQPTDLIVVAARPSMGKTAFAMNLAEAAAMKSPEKKAVAVFSMEMSVEQLTVRMIGSIGRVDAQHMRSGKLSEEDWPRLTNATTQLLESKILIDDTGGLSPAELRSRARRLHRRQPLGLIVIDYLQLMQVPGSKEHRAQQIAEISRQLKALAKELNVPVVALSQLNRSVEQRADKRPLMSDLRESGSIEQDADVIMFLYRDEYYNKDSPDKGVAEIIISKQRNGPTDTVRLAFNGTITRFDNISPLAYDDF